MLIIQPLAFLLVQKRSALEFNADLLLIYDASVWWSPVKAGHSKNPSRDKSERKPRAGDLKLPLYIRRKANKAFVLIRCTSASQLPSYTTFLLHQSGAPT